MFRQTRIRVDEEDASNGAGDAAVRIDRASPDPIVVVTGRLTIETTPRLRSALIRVLRQSSARVLIVDLSGVSHFDTSAFAVFLEVLNCAHERGIRLRLVGISGQPRRLAELAQLDEIFNVFGSEVAFS
jgi:anti-anti-sigma factor